MGGGERRVVVVVGCVSGLEIVGVLEGEIFWTFWHHASEFTSADLAVRYDSSGSSGCTGYFYQDPPSRLMLIERCIRN